MAGSRRGWWVVGSVGVTLLLLWAVASRSESRGLEGCFRELRDRTPDQSVRFERERIRVYVFHQSYKPILASLEGQRSSCGRPVAPFVSTGLGGPDLNLSQSEDGDIEVHRMFVKFHAPKRKGDPEEWELGWDPRETTVVIRTKSSPAWLYNLLSRLGI